MSSNEVAIAYATDVDFWSAVCLLSDKMVGFRHYPTLVLEPGLGCNLIVQSLHPPYNAWRILRCGDRSCQLLTFAYNSTLEITVSLKAA